MQSNKNYIPLDNSYILNMTGDKEELLAGSAMSDPKETLIVSEPYREELETYNGLRDYEFINVQYKGDVYRVLYFPWRVDYSIQEAIEENNKKHSAW